MTILHRGKTLYLKKRVPARFASVETRPVVWISLQTDSPKQAAAKAGPVWDQMVAGWEALLAGHSDDAEVRYQAARDLAQARGFRFLTPERIAKLPVEELSARIEASMTPEGNIDPVLAAGILGAARKPDLKLSKVLDLYWTLAADKTQGKSDDQIRRWRNPRIKAFKNLIDVIGDLPLSEITADDLLDFRSWWWDKIGAEDLTPNSANKDFTHVAGTIRLINQKKQLGLKLDLAGLTFSEGEKRTRVPFSEKWIRDNLLAAGALDGLNREARCILLGMVNTGYRPSEAQGLLRDHIRLDVDYPHISIEPVGRTLKNQSSRRIIPLTGISLAAFRECALTASRAMLARRACPRR